MQIAKKGRKSVNLETDSEQLHPPVRANGEDKMPSIKVPQVEVKPLGIPNSKKR